MEVTVRLFARARDLAGGDRITVALPAGATVRELKEHIVRHYPPLGDLVPRCALAVDAEFAEDGDPVPAGAEVALLPPVSGGQ